MGQVHEFKRVAPGVGADEDVEDGAVAVAHLGNPRDALPAAPDLCPVVTLGPTPHADTPNPPGPGRGSGGSPSPSAPPPPPMPWARADRAAAEARLRDLARRQARTIRLLRRRLDRIEAAQAELFGQSVNYEGRLSEVLRLIVLAGTPRLGGPTWGWGLGFGSMPPGDAGQDAGADAGDPGGDVGFH